MLLRRQKEIYHKYFLSHLGRFKCSIDPREIITADERPNLSGASEKETPNAAQMTFAGIAHPVPTSADTALLKFDMSRQMEGKINNPAGLLKSELGQAYPSEWVRFEPEVEGQQGSNSKTVFEFPEQDAGANDDPLLDGGADEDSNPYEASRQEFLGHAKGEMTSFDQPHFPIKHSWGEPDDVFQFLINFKEFSRLEITSKGRAGGISWFRISDYFEWYHLLSCRKKNETQWQLGGSTGEGSK